MSRQNVDLFYTILAADPVLREKALALKTQFEDQNELIDAFLHMADESGYPFTLEEYMSVMYERAEPVNPNSDSTKGDLS